MSIAESRHSVNSRERLREIVSAPEADGLIVRKQINQLDDHCRNFIARCPFLFLATADTSGRCDVSPRGDAPGFVVVLDDRTIAIPDRPGNRRLDSFENLLVNPNAGLILVIPNVDETLRINGRAWLSEDPDLLARMAVKGKEPLLALIIETDEVYFHCARSFKRGKIWDPDSWIDRSTLPTLGQILKDQAKLAEATVEELDEGLEEANKRLY